MSAASLTLASISSCGRLRELQRERDVVAHGHVRIQRVALEHHRDVAVARGDLVDDLAADPQLAGRDVLEPRDHVQRGRLPATGRPDEDHELAVGDLQVEVLDGRVAVRVLLDDVSRTMSAMCGSFIP